MKKHTVFLCFQQTAYYCHRPPPRPPIFILKRSCIFFYLKSCGLKTVNSSKPIKLIPTDPLPLNNAGIQTF